MVRCLAFVVYLISLAIPTIRPTRKRRGKEGKLMKQIERFSKARAMTLRDIASISLG